jgi:hypothetical protein
MGQDKAVAEAPAKANRDVVPTPTSPDEAPSRSTDQPDIRRFVARVAVGASDPDDDTRGPGRARMMGGLQSSLGNARIGRMLANTPTTVRRKCACGGDIGAGGMCEKCAAKATVAREASGPGSPDVAPPIVNRVLRSGGGRPLDGATRTALEPTFGRDLGHVSVHTGPEAAKAAQSVSARAFAVGSQVVFNDGQYRPETTEGRKLIAHEVTHTVQQEGSAPVAAASPLTVGRTDDPSEREAEQVADSVGKAAVPPSPSPATARRSVQREGDSNTTPTPGPSPAPAPVPAQDQPPAQGDKPGFFGSLLNNAKAAASSITEGAAEAAKIVARLATIAVNPAQIVPLLAEIAWERIPTALKGPILNKILDICLLLVNLGDALFVQIGFLGFVLKNALIGFLQRARSYPDDLKVMIANRMAKLWASPSMAFTLGFLKGLVLGLWDGITGPFILLWDLAKFIGFLIETEVKVIRTLVVKKLRDQMFADVKATWGSVSARMKKAIDEFLGSKMDPAKVYKFIAGLIETAAQKIKDAGASMADAVQKFLQEPDAELGEDLGRVEGNILFEVILLILTEGGYTLIKEGLSGLKVVTRLIEIGGEAWEAIAPVRAAMVGFARTIRGIPVLAELFDAVGEVLALIIKFLKFSYGLGGPAGAAERAGEKATARAGERGLAEEGEGAAGAAERKRGGEPEPEPRGGGEVPEALAGECQAGSLICPLGIPKKVRGRLDPYPHADVVPEPKGELRLRGSKDADYAELRAAGTTDPLRRTVLQNPELWTEDFAEAVEAAKAAARKENRKLDLLHTDWPRDAEGKAWEVHHRKPLDFGGDNEAANLIPIEKSVHKELTGWWRSLKKDLSEFFSESDWEKLIGGRRDEIFDPSSARVR